ncbi:MAG: cytochrome c peroxidase, partial [Planctomycetota bacterium]
GSRQIACASCHDPELGWADGRTTGFGHNRIRLPRHSPTIRNAGLHRQLFWDGRVDSLEQQVIDVVNSPDEMHSSAEHVAELIREQYDYRGGIFSIYRKKLQLTAVPDVASLSDEQILQCVSEVIACFERTIVGGQSRWDAFLLGRRDALTDQELLGLDLFRQDGRCMNCHHGPLMTDGKFHNLGLARFDRGQTDPGRYAVTEDLDDIGKFRTPSLRDVSRTGPYMHNGLLDLSTALRFYNRGMFQPPAVVIDGQSVSPQKSSHLRPLGMTTSELSALESFLRALEEPWSRVETPSFPDFERSEE